MLASEAQVMPVDDHAK